MAAAIEGAMRRRQKKCPLPRLWLFTDERIADDRLLAAVATLPRGTGIVFRHYRLDADERRMLYDRVKATARRRGLVLLLAGTPALARTWRADGVHIPGWRRDTKPAAARGLRTASAHDEMQVIAATRAGADLIFLSPLFPTRSHPGARTLGPLRFGLIARDATVPVVALGGMTRSRFRRVKPLGAHGWAAIDALV